MAEVTLFLAGQPLTFTTGTARVEGCRTQGKNPDGSWPRGRCIQHPDGLPNLRNPNKRRAVAKKKNKPAKAPARKPGELPPQPKLKVADEDGQAEPRSWQLTDNAGDRAAGIWTETFPDQQNVRRAFRNIRDGRDVLDGVVIPDREGTEYFDAEDEDGNPQFTEDDYHNDIISAARWLTREFGRQSEVDEPLFRGMRLRAAEVPQPGDRFSTDISSWTEDDGEASYFAGLDENPALGRAGDTQVIFELAEPQRAVILGSWDDFDARNLEYLLEGTFEVTGTETDPQGRTRVQVRRVS